MRETFSIGDLDLLTCEIFKPEIPQKGSDRFAAFTSLTMFLSLRFNILPTFLGCGSSCGVAAVVGRWVKWGIEGSSGVEVGGGKEDGCGMPAARPAFGREIVADVEDLMG